MTLRSKTYVSISQENTGIISVTPGADREQILSFLDFPYRAFSQGFKTLVVKGDFHTLIKNVTDVGSHNLHLFRRNVLAGTPSPLQSM